MDFAKNPAERKSVTPGAAEPLGPLPIPVQNTIVDPEQKIAQPEPISRFVLWTHRLSLVVFVVFCIELGMLLAILPWTAVWNQNTFTAAHPNLRMLLQNNFVRGVATGLGVIDIWVGIWEAVHYHDPGKS